MTKPTSAALASSGPVETTADVIARLMDALERYAGWLSNGGTGLKPVPGQGLRAHVHGLRAAIDAGTDTRVWIQLIDGDLHRLPSGEIPKMLRRTLTEISSVLESSHHEEETERGS